MSTSDKTVKKTIKKVTVLNKELFENAGMQEKLAQALEKLKKGWLIRTLLLAFVTRNTFFQRNRNRL